MAFREVHVIEIKEILLRLASKESIRSISVSLGIHRDTIRNYIKLSISFGFNPQNDSRDFVTDDLVLKIKSALFYSNAKQNKAPRYELLLPVKDKIEGYLKNGLKGSKIISLLAREGINVCRDSFYRFIKQNCENYKDKNITVRLPETEPGKYAQVDFGRLGKIVDNTTGELKTVFGLIFTLAFSRHMFVFVTFKQTTEEIIAGFEASFAYFGGIFKIAVIDNLKPAVTKANNYNPAINKTFLEYAQVRQFIVDPCVVAAPKGKPIVERAVSYVRENFFKGENFISKNDCQQRADIWCTNTAGLRIHGTTKLAPLKVFDEFEKEKLIPFSYDRYDIAFWAICKVHPDHHIRFKNSLYSLPTKYIGKHVEVRGDSALVKIFFNGKVIKIHMTARPGSRSTDFNDYPAYLTPYALRNPSYQIKKGYEKSEVIGKFIEEILSGPYPWHRLRSAQKILRLAEVYGVEKLSAALKKAEHYGITDMRRIENILRNNAEGMSTIQDKKDLSENSQLRFLREPASFNHYK